MTASAAASACSLTECRRPPCCPGSAPAAGVCRTMPSWNASIRAACALVAHCRKAQGEPRRAVREHVGPQRSLAARCAPPALRIAGFLRRAPARPHRVRRLVLVAAPVAHEVLRVGVEALARAAGPSSGRGPGAVLSARRLPAAPPRWWGVLSLSQRRPWLLLRLWSWPEHLRWPAHAGALPYTSAP